MSRKILGPFSRVEGHLEIELDRSENSVSHARVNSPMFRGMETVMLNRTPMDALTIAPRICGICSVSQSVAAARALADLSGVQAPKNGQLVTNLILGTEMLSNHLTHFYMFFMPDFARAVYENENWYKTALRFKAEAGSTQPVALEARSKLLHIMGILAGKWPHTLTIRPGGTTQSIKNTEKLKLKSILLGFRRFLEQTVFGTSLEETLALASENDLRNWAKNNQSDLATFIHFSNQLGLNEMGKTSSVLLTGGGSPFTKGIYKNGEIANLPVPDIKEDISHSFMTGPVIQTPHEGLTDPYLDKDSAYSWCKSPRLDGARCEVGALARHVIQDETLFQDLYKRHTSTVENRIFARVWEMAKLVQHMERWVDEIDPAGTFYEEADFPANGQAIAFVEAARGTLGHWISIKDHVISNYQIIAPTTWNFSPRDHIGQPGPLEDALEDAPIRKDEEDPVSVQHIVRSFDPCMACTVH